MFDQLIGNPFTSETSPLQIDSQVLHRLLIEGQAAFPHEYSALLAGHHSIATMHLPAPQSEASLHTFAWSGPTLLASLRRIQEAGLQWIGVFHTHPTSPAIPSSADLAGWHYPTLGYWIASLQHPENPEVLAYQLINGRFISKAYTIM
ncbi:Mov34/MPN/PAD-1 family protein [Brevibacillus ginsengisoli]|uniref:Mov34/MPN/PAD-1 family protein n=1 Tax=Brevibacillus ginsengisoli TaxID=363854 RepID=UPI003CF7AB84